MLCSQYWRVEINERIDTVVVIWQSYHFHFLHLIYKGDIVFDAVIYFFSMLPLCSGLFKSVNKRFSTSVEDWNLIAIDFNQYIINLHAYKRSHQVFNRTYSGT